MKNPKAATYLVLLTLVAAPLFAAEGDDGALGQFQQILAGIDSRKFAPIQAAIDEADLSNRILNSRIIEPAARKVLNDNFWEIIEEGFLQSLPPANSNIKVQLVDFAFENGKGHAGVRFKQPNFEFAYQVFELRYDGRSRLKIVDWFDSSKGLKFSAEIGEQLVILMPTRAATQKQISINNPSDLELFQVTEIFKAARDRQPARYFQIYDEFSEPLKREPFVAKNAVFLALASKDTDRFVPAMDIFAEVFAQDPKFALIMSDLFVSLQKYEESYDALKRFHADFSVQEGAIPARLSALALALGQMEDAEMYALEATEDEPTLELGWWSLLRVRARAGDHQGSLEALTYLEDNFGHRLDETKLRRDKFQGFASLISSEEFKEWRDGRN